MKMTIFIAAISLLLNACATPQIYIIDRQTIMETDASGEWPQTEAYLLSLNQKAGPTFFAKSTTQKKQKKMKNILNGEIQK